MEAIEKNKTPTIDEDGLLDMIRNAKGKKSKYDEAASSSATVSISRNRPILEILVPDWLITSHVT